LNPPAEKRCPVYDPMKHNYMKRLWELYLQGKIPEASLSWVDIYHDDWCGIYRGRYCNCDPVLRLLPEPHLDPRRN
jgi:hypothetical protein